MKRFTVLLMVLFLSTAFFSFAGNTDASLAKKDDGRKYDRLSVIVKFRDGLTKDQRKQVLKLVDGRIKDRNNDGKDDRFKNILKGNLAKIELKKSKTADMAADALAKLSNHPYLEYAEFNYAVNVLVVPNDPRFTDLWGLNNTGQLGGTNDADIDAVEAWDITTGSSEVVVGVIDTGIDYNHPDLAANMWTNPSEIPGNGIDDDNNGYIDDMHGINSIEGSGNPMDDHYHGTHCAGTIGAKGNDNYGVAGVCWNVKLVGMKFLDSAGSGYSVDAIECIDYAVGLVNNGVNLRVLSNSWGGGGFEQSLKDAIAAANSAGILFVAAAGNDGTNNDSVAQYPCNYDVGNVLSIAATDQDDALAAFSNYGLLSVDLGAPGVNIWSTIPNNSYTSLSGTSMATPHVSGVAALMLSYNNTLTVSELKSILMDSGDAISALSGNTVSGKRLNAFNAVSQTPAPYPTFGLDVSPGAQSIVKMQSTSYTIDITSNLGFSSPVSLTYTSTPPINANITFNPNPGLPGSTSTMNIVTTESTTPGDYIIDIVGTSGTITKTVSVNLQVVPENLGQLSYSNTTTIAIPDANYTGIDSTINVPDSMFTWSTTVTVNITHPWRNDIVITLISPSGTEVVLRDREGGSDDDIHQTITTTAFRGEDSFGVWTLNVADCGSADVGTLDDWSLTIEGELLDANNFPNLTINSPADNASFSSGASITFSATATDIEDGDISSSIQWTSSIDGNIGSGGQFSTSALSDGAHTITATVTDSGGRSVQESINILAGSYQQLSYTNNTPLLIPDNNSTGITSTIEVPAAVNIADFSVEVNITHTFIGDLVVKLVSPQGTEVILHNKEGSSADNINKTYYPTDFNGENSSGTWSLVVSDHWTYDTGRLDSWTINIEGSGY